MMLHRSLLVRGRQTLPFLRVCQLLANQRAGFGPRDLNIIFWRTVGDKIGNEPMRKRDLGHITQVFNFQQNPYLHIFYTAFLFSHQRGSPPYHNIIQ